MMLPYSVFFKYFGEFTIPRLSPGIHVAFDLFDRPHTLVERSLIVAREPTKDIIFPEHETLSSKESMEEIFS